MKELALSRPYEAGLWSAPDESGSHVLSYSACAKRLNGALNRSVQNLCNELFSLVSHAAACSVYELGGYLGKGSFGVVRQVVRRADSQPLALKLISKAGSRADEVDEELRILRLVSPHPNIVGLADSFETLECWGMVFELGSGGPLFERIASRGGYSESDAALVLRQLGSALVHMHGKKIVHRDIKPENLLLRRPGDDSSVCVCDFGVSIDCESRECTGTLLYMAPEVLREEWYGAAIDVWASGIVLFNLLSAAQPFDPDPAVLRIDGPETERRILASEWSFEGRAWHGVSDHAKSLLRRMLHPDAAERVSASGMLSDEWTIEGGAPSAPLLGASDRLRAFNDERSLWRGAMRALTLLAYAPPSQSTTPGVTSVDWYGYTPELKAAFAALDLDGNGRIDESELRELLRSLGAADGEIEEVTTRTMGALDANGDGQIDFDEVRS